MTPRPFIVCAAAIEGRGVADAVLGVGKTAAAMRTTELLIRSRPSWLLLIGVCGAYQAAPPGLSLAVGDLCVVGEDRLADEGVALAGDGFQGIASMELGDEGPFRSDPALAQTIASRLGIPIVSGATVSTCSGRDDLADRTRAAERRAGRDDGRSRSPAGLSTLRRTGCTAAVRQQSYGRQADRGLGSAPRRRAVGRSCSYVGE